VLSLEQEKKKLAETVSSLETDMNKAKAEKEAIVSDYTKLQEALEKLKQTTQKNLEREKQLLEKVSSLESEINNKQQYHSKQINDTAKMELIELKQTLENSELELDAYKLELDTYKARDAEMNTSLKNFEQQYKIEKEKRVNLEKDHKTQIKNISELKKKLKDNKDQTSQMKVDITAAFLSIS